MILSRLRRLVDQATFDATTCHRCGQSCRYFWLGKSALALMAGYMPWTFHYCDARCATDDIAAHIEWRLMARWLLQLEPVDDYPDALQCPRLGEVDGVPTCMRYDERPRTCSQYPYGRPSDYAQCAWYADVIDYGPVFGLEAA